MTDRACPTRRARINAAARHLWIGVAAAAGLTLAAPAEAQLAPGYSGTSGTRHLSDPDGWFAIRQLGACLARSKPEESRALMAAEPGSDAESRAVESLIGRETSCLRMANYLIFTRDRLRGSVAEALYLQSFRAPPPAAPAASAEVEVSDLRSFGRCFVLLRPDLAHQLLSSTRMGQAEERELLSGMGGELGQCLPAGLTLSLDAQSIRIALAEALYARATSPVEPAAPAAASASR